MTEGTPPRKPPRKRTRKAPAPKPKRCSPPLSLKRRRPEPRTSQRWQPSAEPRRDRASAGVRGGCVGHGARSRSQAAAEADPQGAGA